MVVLFWQLVVWSGWRPEFVLPSPFTVFQRLGEMLHTTELWKAVGVTMERAVKGYALALVIGCALGSLVVRSRVMRAAVGSLITGLQTMPSVAWFPLALTLFKISEAAIMFVVVLGAAPSIANGLVHGRRPHPARAAPGGQGARRSRCLGVPPRRDPGRPPVVRRRAEAGLGVLLAQPDGRRAASWSIANKKSLGFLLDVNRAAADDAGLIAIMIVILVLGILVDALVFAQLDKRLRRRWGLELD